MFFTGVTSSRKIHWRDCSVIPGRWRCSCETMCCCHSSQVGLIALITCASFIYNIENKFVVYSFWRNQLLLLIVSDIRYVLQIESWMYVSVLNTQMCILSQSVGQYLYLSVGGFLWAHLLYLWMAKILMRLCIFSVPFEPLLFAYMFRPLFVCPSSSLH